MTRLPRVNGRDMARALQRGGFTLSHVRGSHHYFPKPSADGLVTVPIHGSKTLPIGAIRSILRQAGLKPNNWRDYSGNNLGVMYPHDHRIY